jgi:hypothetical protein
MDCSTDPQLMQGYTVFSGCVGHAGQQVNVLCETTPPQGLDGEILLSDFISHGCHITENLSKELAELALLYRGLFSPLIVVCFVGLLAARGGDEGRYNDLIDSALAEMAIVAVGLIAEAVVVIQM